MKIFALALLTSISAFAGQTVIEHNFGAVLKNIDIQNACVTELTVNSIQPQKICAEYEEVKMNDGDGGYYTDYRCVRTEKKILSYSRSFQKVECVEYRQIGSSESGYLQCVRSESKAMFMPQTIRVREVTSNGDATNWPGVTKSFTFPYCH